MKDVAVITGSRGGIGRELVGTFLDQGFHVIGLDASIKKQTYGEALHECPADLYRFAKDETYRVSILGCIRQSLPAEIARFSIINNAAVQILKLVSEIQWADWDRSLAINTVAPFFLAREFKDLLSATKGHVVNISSIHAKLSKQEFTCYAASKAALEATTRSLALELSPMGISVNAIAPAAILTPMLAASFEGEEWKLEDLKEHHPSGGIGSPRQLASFVRAITEQRDGFLTGAVLDFNGGIAGRLHDPS